MNDLAIPFGDVNGDGFQDVASLFSRTIGVFHGGAGGLPTTPSWSFTPTSGTLFGMAGADVNGDGFQDLLCADTDAYVRIFYGSATGLPASPSVVLNSLLSGIDPMVALGDLDQDGFDDVAVDLNFTGTNEQLLLHGSADGLDVGRSTLLLSPTGAHVVHPALLGDVDGDGWDDVAANKGLPSTVGYLYYGSPDGLEAPVPWVSGYARGAGDVNGDGFADAVVHVDESPQSVEVYLGSAAGLPSVADAVLLPCPVAAGDPDSDLHPAGAGDLNGDGYDDVVVTMSHFTQWSSVEVGSRGGACVYFGGAAGLETSPSWWAVGNMGGPAGPASGVGDVDGDGLDDLLVLNRLSRNGRTLVIPGDAADFAPQLRFPGTTGVREPGYRGLVVVGRRDLNGDGVHDLIVGGTTIFGFAGGPTQTFDGADWSFDSSLGGLIPGLYVAMIQDQDADGDDELLVGGEHHPLTASHPPPPFSSLFLGGEPPATRPSWFRSTRWEPYRTVTEQWMADAGDFDGDGVGDFLIGDVANPSVIHLFLDLFEGGVEAPSAFSWSLEATDNDYVHPPLAGVGDVDGDGFDDVVVGLPKAGLGAGAIEVIYGHPDPSSARTESLMGDGGLDGAFGLSVAGAGDVDGDGFDDVLVGANRGAAVLYRGEATGLDPVPWWTAPLIAGSLEHGYQVAGAGDVNADGFDDILLRARSPRSDDFDPAEGIRVLLGGPTGPMEDPWWQSPTGWGSGLTAAGVGDIDDDGYDDVALGGHGSFLIVRGGEVPELLPKSRKPDAPDPDPTEPTDTGEPTEPSTTDTTTPEPTTTEPSPTEPAVENPSGTVSGGGGCGCAAGLPSAAWMGVLGLGALGRRRGGRRRAL